MTDQATEEQRADTPMELAVTAYLAAFADYEALKGPLLELSQTIAAIADLRERLEGNFAADLVPVECGGVSILTPGSELLENKRREVEKKVKAATAAMLDAASAVARAAQDAMDAAVLPAKPLAIAPPNPEVERRIKDAVEAEWPALPRAVDLDREQPPLERFTPTIEHHKRVGRVRRFWERVQP
jgi:hypothetical protein